MDRKKLAKLLAGSARKQATRWDWARNAVIIALFLLFVIISLIKPENGARYLLHWGIWLPLTTYVIFWECRRYLWIYSKAIRGVFDMYTLIGLAAHVIYIFCIVQISFNWNANPNDAKMPWDAPGLLLGVSLAGEKIEHALQNETGGALRELYAMRKRDVTVVVNGVNETKSARDLLVGDVMLIPKGQVVLADGTALDEASLDYTNITGESKMRYAKPGDEITSGALNIGEPVTIRVTRLAKESALFKIIDSLLAASSAKPRLQRLADQALRWFVLVVIGIALGAFVVWLIIGLTVYPDLSWNAVIGSIRVPADAWRVSIEVGVTVLATACPCALGIATPIISLITAQGLHKRGILIHNPAAIENIGKIEYVAFDKTGTLTMSRLSIAWNDASPEQVSIAKALESGIEHPIARAFRSLEGQTVVATSVKTLDSLGVTGIVNGVTYALRAAQIKDNPRPDATWIGLFEGERQLAKFALVNEVRPQAKEFISWLNENGIVTVMMTGDEKTVADHVGKQLGLTEIHAALTPNEKHSLVADLRAKGRVMFIGDGFNDSIATQSADISAAFASGSDIVNTFADFSIVTDGFDAVNDLFKIAVKHNRTIKFSLTWAMVFNCLAIPVAVLGLIPPWAGAVLMIGSDVLVLSNALLYRYKLKRMQEKNKEKLSISDKPAQAEEFVARPNQSA